MLKGPCKKDCLKRSETCHFECQAYIDYAKECEKERQKRHDRALHYYNLREASARRPYYCR